MKKLTDLTEQRIQSVVAVRANCQTDWSKHYWDTVLAYLLRQANRLN